MPSLELIGARYGADSTFHSLPDDNQTYSGLVRETPSKWLLKAEYLSPISTWPSLVFALPTSSSSNNSPNNEKKVIQQSIRFIEQVNSSAGDLFSDDEESNVNSYIVPVERDRHHEYIAETNKNSLKRRLVFPYATALGLTVGLGCALLIVNVLVWVFLKKKKRQKKRVVIIEDERESPPPTPPVSAAVDSRSSPSQHSSSITINTYCDNPPRVAKPAPPPPTECDQCAKELCQNCPETRSIYQNSPGLGGGSPRTMLVPMHHGRPHHVDNHPLLHHPSYNHYHPPCTYDVHPPCITPCTNQRCTEIIL